jgi:hypothetical protein
VFLIGPQGDCIEGDRVRRTRVSKDIRNVNTSHVNNIKPSIPLALVTLNPESLRVSCRLVIDYGDGVLENIDDEDDEGQSGLHKLSQGAHAFVRCYGESFLRCTTNSFEFGSAGGHPLLANFSQVLMAGEVEVNEEGILTRWLNKSGLYMPPRFVIGQAGLPFEYAWMYLSQSEVSAMEPSKKNALIEYGCLQLLPRNSSLPSSTAAADDVCKHAPVVMPQTPITQSLNTGQVEVDLDNDECSVSSAATIDADDAYASASDEPQSVHGMDTWILKVGDDSVWDPSISTSAYIVAKDAVARFHKAKSRAKKRILKLRRVGSNDSGRVGSVSSSSSSSSSIFIGISRSFSHSKTVDVDVAAGNGVNGVSGVDSEDLPSWLRMPIAVSTSKADLFINKKKSRFNNDGAEDVELGNRVELGVNIESDLQVHPALQSHVQTNERVEFSPPTEIKTEMHNTSNMMSNNRSQPLVSKNVCSQYLIEEEERRVRAKVKAMEREMMAAGVFDAHKQGAAERSKRKAELGFSSTLRLNAEVEDV